MENPLCFLNRSVFAIIDLQIIIIYIELYIIDGIIFVVSTNFPSQYS